MDTTARTVDHLDKVTLKLSVSSSSGQRGSETQAAETNIIYGIGVEGITPFEKLLFGKSVGDQLTLPIENGCGEAIFGHLWRLVFNEIAIKLPFHLQVTILAIQSAEGREVIQAMAKMAPGCTGGCDCGCGCS